MYKKHEQGEENGWARSMNREKRTDGLRRRWGGRRRRRRRRKRWEDGGRRRLGFWDEELGF